MNRVVCAKLGPHGTPCCRRAGHEHEAITQVAMHGDQFGREWSDVPVAPPLSAAEVQDRYNQAWAPPPVVTPTITGLAAKVTERLAALERVRPILAAAVAGAAPDQAAAFAILSCRVSSAIMRD